MNNDYERAETKANAYILSAGEVFGILWRRAWVIALVTLSLVGAALGFHLLQTPTYESYVRVLIADEGAEGEGNLGGTIEGLQLLTQTLVEGAKSVPVAEDVARRVNFPTSATDVLADLSVTQVGNTQFIEVSYKAASPEQAQQVTQAMGEVMSERISEITPISGNITARVWEPATLPTYPKSADPLVSGVLTLALGLTLGVALAFLLEYRDDRWRSLDEVNHVSGVPNLGAIPKLERSSQSRTRQKVGR